MLTYLGVGFVLCGMFIFLVLASNPVGLSPHLSLGVVIFGMGLTLCYLGQKSKTEEGIEVVEATYSPLSYVQSELERRQSLDGATSGNRAFGFVLISLGAFVLTVYAFFGILGWILLLLGIGFTASGVMLRFR